MKINVTIEEKKYYFSHLFWTIIPGIEKLYFYRLEKNNFWEVSILNREIRQYIIKKNSFDVTWSLKRQDVVHAHKLKYKVIHYFKNLSSLTYRQWNYSTSLRKNKRW